MSSPRLSIVIPVRKETIELLPRLASSVHSLVGQPGVVDADVLLVSLTVDGSVMPPDHVLIKLIEPVAARVIGYGFSGPGLEMAINAACAHAKGDWLLVMYPTEQLGARGALPSSLTEMTAVCGPGGSVAEQSATFRRQSLVELLESSSDFGAVAVVACEDEKGLGALMCRPAARFAKRVQGIVFGPNGFRKAGESLATVPWTVPMLDRPFIYQPLTAYHLELGQYAEAVRLGSGLPPSSFEYRFFIKARTALDSEKAFQALKTLFNHACLYEELGVARDLLSMMLPYTIEEDPRLDVMRAQLKKQIGHLSAGELAWYSSDAVAETITVDAAIAYPMTPRAQWIVNEARSRGLKRVVEFGASDGLNIIKAVQYAPEIEWHGVECNPKSVANAQAIAKEAGLAPLNLHCSSFGDFSRDNAGAFDAAFCFEVLEHQFDPTTVLNDVEGAVKTGGRVFLTTPCGAWSLHNPETFSLEIKKEHVLAWTPRRTQRVLESRRATEIVVVRVENPAWHEANAWLFTTYVPGSRA